MSHDITGLGACWWWSPTVSALMCSRKRWTAGHLPSMAQLRRLGSLRAISSAFPSVTGPAYAPFVMGRHPAHVGMPGLRWYDRARSLRLSPASARSYSGVDIWHVDGDLTPSIPRSTTWRRRRWPG